MGKTKIEWTGYSWNPITGCDPDDGYQSEACINCYARRISKRFAGRYGYLKYDPFEITKHRGRFNEPLKIKKPHRIFTCSMGDLFHKSVPMQTILEIFDIMHRADQHQFIVLTKRPHRMLEFCQKYGLIPGSHGFTESGETWPDNVIAMITAENQARLIERFRYLEHIPAKCKGISFEPLLGPINLTERWCHQEGTDHDCDTIADHIDIVIVGGETGPGARPMHPDWVRKIRDDCIEAGVPFFFKSWGEYGTTAFNMTTGKPVFKMYENKMQSENKWNWAIGGRCIDMSGKHIKISGDFNTAQFPVAIMRKLGKKKAGRLLDGKEWNQWPER